MWAYAAPERKTETMNAPTVSPLAMQSLGQLPAVFRDRAGQGRLNDELSGGITAGFGILSLRGKVWRVKYQGVERPLLNEQGHPAYAIPVIILKAAPNLSKVWYEHGYVEGSTAPPDCWSVNGKVPDPASPKLQNPTCGGCRWNAWGSSRTQGGSGKGKDCADSKRFAITPLNDIANEAFGGPLLFRVPPASLAEVFAYASGLEQLGYPYYAVATEMSFDPNAEYPKVKFKPLRVLTEAEALAVMDVTTKQEMLIERILAAPVDEVHTDGADLTHTDAAKVPPVPQQTAQQAPVAAAPAPAPQQAPQKAPDAGPIPAFLVRTTEPAPAPTPQGNVVVLDPKAEQRQKMRDIGLTEEQIVAALGPEPKAPEPLPAPVDPRIEQMRAMGLTDVQINAALGLGQSVNTPAPGEAPKRRRRSKEEMEAARAAQAAGQASTPAAAPALQQAAQPTPNGHAPVAETQTIQSSEVGDLPAGFDDLLDGLIAKNQQ